MSHFTFVITAHKSFPLAKRCIESIQAQLGSFSFSTLYVDDCSGYNKAEIRQLEKWLQLINGELIVLPSRHYQIGALAKVIPRIQSPDSIVCLVDGDDYLLCHALKT